MTVEGALKRPSCLILRSSIHPRIGSLRSALPPPPKTPTPMAHDRVKSIVTLP